MVQLKSNALKTKLLSEQIRELAIDNLELPRFSLPFVGSGYSLERKRRIMVVYFQTGIEKDSVYGGKRKAYSDSLYKNADRLFKKPESLRVNPYVIEDSGFNLSYLIENVEKGMTCNDIVIHRFMPYPKIEGIDGSFDENIYRKAVDFFVGLVDCCQPTHMFFINPNTAYLIDEVYRKIQKQSLDDFFSERYIIPVYGSDLFNWSSFVPMDEDDGFIWGCACDLLSEIDFAKVALEDPRLIPAMYWDDEKIKYYGANPEYFERYTKNPTEVKKSLLDENLPRNIRTTLIRPFENLRYSQILYTLLDRCPSEYYEKGDDWASLCKWISLYNENIKAYGKELRKTKDVYGRAKIRSLSIKLQYALYDLAKKLRLEYDSKKLAVVRDYIEELYQETEKLYAVRNPLKLTSITRMQLVARSMNLEDFKNENRSRKKSEDNAMNYRPKKISEKQRMHLARIRLRRWPKPDKVDNAE